MVNADDNSHNSLCAHPSNELSVVACILLKLYMAMRVHIFHIHPVRNQISNGVHSRGNRFSGFLWVHTASFICALVEGIKGSRSVAIAFNSRTNFLIINNASSRTLASSDLIPTKGFLIAINASACPMRSQILSIARLNSNLSRCAATSGSDRVSLVISTEL